MRRSGGAGLHAVGYDPRQMTNAASPDTQILAALRATFGYPSFRPLQRDVVHAILAGQDVFVLMPTGGGKSLCYQLPALLRDGLSVVVSPLIALMKDQVDALRALGVAATFINSSLDLAEIGRRQAAVARGDVKILYVAPERLMMPGFLHLLKAASSVFFAIDEAHCISEWGHDFRPEYRELARLRALVPEAGIGAFTATATPRVQADIIAQLGLQNAASFRGSFNRANLFYEVRPKRDQYRQLTAFLREWKDASGIIYCQSRAGSDELAAKLRADGFNAASYHAGLDGAERPRRQEAFVRDDTRIIVATIAFGMGIDKPDVRFVVHYDLPKNLEGYYQESGRAGRDGEPAVCLLFFSAGDVGKHEYFINQKPTLHEQQVARQQLRRMAGWAESVTCRRRALLAYFDEPFDGQPGPCCDVCRDAGETVDATTLAQMLLSCVARTGQRFGMAYVIDVLRGSRGERILRNGHDRLPTHGIGRDRSKEEWQHLGQQLLQAGYLQQTDDEYRIVEITARGKEVLFQGERVLVAAPRTARSQGEAPGVPGSSSDADGGPVPNEALFEQLRALRKRLADERSLPPYVIFHDSVLRSMAARLPASEAALLQLPGIGQQKVEAYGEAFLACIAAFVAGTGAQPVDLPPTAPRRPRPEAGASARATLELFNRGQSLAEVAAARGLAMTTVENHLAQAIEAGEPVDLARLVSPERRAAIEAALDELGEDSMLRPIMDFLGDGFTYAEIKVVRATLSAARSLAEQNA